MGTDQEMGILEPYTGACYGYARVSMQNQELDLQLDALMANGVKKHNIFIEKISGKLLRAERPQLKFCMEVLREGDTLVVWKLDRLGRSLRDLINIITELEEKKVRFRSLTECIDTTSPMGRFMFHLIGAFSEFERNLIKERSLAGLVSARKRGIVGGRRFVLSSKEQNALIAMHKDNIKIQDILEHFKISRTTLYNYLHRHHAIENRPLRHNLNEPKKKE